LNSLTAERAELLADLFQAGVTAVSGYDATRAALLKRSFESNVVLVAVGKAADSMARGALSVLGDKVRGGLVVTKHHHLSDQLKSEAKIVCLESGHPVPDQASLLAGKRLKEFVGSVSADQQLLFLVSGGASALVEHLVDGLSLDDLKQETDRLLASGAAIGEMNRHRRTLSEIKGGRLASDLNCKVLQLLISDVPGDHLADIGSGLLIPDESTGMPKDLPVWSQVDTEIIASSAIAQEAVAVAALERGCVVMQRNGSLHGEMQLVRQRLSDVVADKAAAPGVYIWGGEPTVVLPEAPGRGGRNQHLALSLVSALSTRGSASLLVAGTDGTDGPTQDAGGIISDITSRLCGDANLDIDDYLVRADAGTCLEKIEALLTTGPTGTNVMDLAIAILD